MNKIILILTILFSSTFMFGQINQLNKAVKKGANTDGYFVASFKNLENKKENAIKNWCKEHNYVIVDISTFTKERFGGNRIKYIDKVKFANQHDYYLKKATASRASSRDMEHFLDNFSSSPKTGIVYNNLVTNARSVSACEKYYKKYPSHQIHFTNRAFDIAKNGNMQDKSEFVNYFSQSDKSRIIQGEIDAEKRKVADAQRRADAEQKHKEIERKKRQSQMVAKGKADAAAKAAKQKRANANKYADLKRSVGKEVYWTEKETYKTGSSGSGLGDLLIGDIYKSTYVIEYLAVVEQIIGSNRLKVIITDVGIKDPGMASYNYLQARPQVLGQAQSKIGQTRVKSFDDIENWN